VHVHFQTSTKCIEVLCGEEMHDGWWVAVGIQKPGNEPTPIASKFSTQVARYGINIF
jgi:hypothetical protein